jgi:hypothetical protein
MASTRQVQQPSSAPIVAAAAVALAGAFAWKGWPFALPLWLGLAVWGWTEPPVLLTGRKDASGMATPAGPGEQKALRRWAAAGQLKWRPVTPNADWLPGWLPRASWFAALVAAAVAWSAPVVTEKLRWANAAAAYLAWMSAVGVRRRTMVDDDVCPGAKLDTLAETVRSAPQVAAGALVAAGAAGWAAATFAPKWDPWAVGPGGPDTVAYQSPEALAGLASFGVRHPMVFTVACAAAGALAVVAVPWVNRALEHWRIVVAGRAEWNPRWLSLKFDPPPFLVDRQQVGSATVDTFFAPSAQGSAAFYQLRAKVEPTIGAGTKVAILETPNESPEGPVPGTLHPLRFEVVSWPTEQFPDPGDPSTPPEVAALWARCAFDWAHDTLGYGRPVLLGVEALHTPDSPTAAWTSSWAWPGGPGLSVVREQTLGDVGGQLGCDALIDHRSDELFFGVLDPDAETDFAADTNPPYAVRFERLALEDTWTFRWGEALKQATHAPVVEHSTTAEAKLADGTVIYRQVFVTRLGIDPREFATAGQERKIATALQAAPFVTVRGFPLAGQRRGERHPQAVAVFWSKAPIPNSPQLLAPVPRGGPNNATEWVLGGLMNDAFDHGRLSRPEVTDAVCLTQPDARAHLWRITVRLHDGVTLSDVRGAAARIRQSLGVEWLRVTPVTDGAMLFCGVRPEVAKLASERRDRQVLIALDWEQAFLDAGVTGQNGLLPQLVASSALPANEQVQVLDFTLPPGLSATQVSAAIPKLSTATNNTFVELRPGPNAQTVRLLASVDDPLPAKVAFDFGFVDATEKIPFATGVEGTPLEFDHLESPHVLLAGTTGSGKSVMAQSFVYGAVVRGWQVYVIDPVKGGADFVFAQDRCWAFAQTPFEAAGVMRSVYAEVVRRKTLNSQHGVGSIDELPDDLRPPRIMVLIDEFTSLMGLEQVPKSDDPEMQEEIEQLEAINRAKVEVGVFAGKIAREARSAGVHLALGTQKLAASLLEKLPGASDLKVNLARTLLGKATNGDRMSALRAPFDAPDLGGDVPKGRGLWEPLSSSAMVAQCWFAPQSELREALVARVPALDPSLVLDLSQFAPAEREETTGPPPLRPPSSGARPAPARVPEAAEAAEVVDVDEMELSLDDLDTDDDGLEVTEELAGIEITWGAPDDVEAVADGPVQEADVDDELVWDPPVLEVEEVVAAQTSSAPQPAVDATIDLGDPGWLTEEPVPAPEPAEEDDPFAAPPPPRLADDEDDEFAVPPPLRPVPDPDWD